MKRVSSALMVWCRLALAIALVLYSSGCATDSGTSAGSDAAASTSSTPVGSPSTAKPAPPGPEGDGVLRVNDLVSITFAGISNPPPRHDERVKEDGSITPSSLFPPVKAMGKSPLVLQRELQEQYNKFYRNLTVTVATENRFFFVSGEVRNPNRFVHSGETTLLAAIATAGHFTDFARRRQVQVTRANGQKLVVDCIKAQAKSELDIPVFPGDKIEVPRRRL